jgi:hypothetical protein
MLNIKRLESQIMYKSLGARNLKALNGIPEISHGHQYLREETLRFDNNYII